MPEYELTTFAEDDLKSIARYTIDTWGLEQAKGSRNNNSPEFAPRFVSGWVDLREHNRRRRKSDVEDCASEDRPNLARRWDAKMGSYFFASPK